jgi:F-type H+-transporting ATPase subunit alpha
MVGRVVNTLGFPIDGKGPIGGVIPNAFGRKAPGVIFRQPVLNHYKQGLKQLML